MIIDKNEDKEQLKNGDKTQIIQTKIRNIDSIKNKNIEKKNEHRDNTICISQKLDEIPDNNQNSELNVIKPNVIDIKDDNDNKEHLKQDSSEKSVSRSILSAGHLVKGRYVIEALIGHGGLCDVYRAKDKVLESSGSESPYVALKVLQREYVDQPETTRMLIREAQHTQTLSHPNIIRVFDFGVDNKIYFIVMEYLDGETIEELIQRSRPTGLPFKKAIIIFNQVLDALSYAHSLNIVHADLKPANIMLESNGNVKILDFGVSNMERANQDQYAAQKIADAHNLLGYTPNYASINILKGNKPKREDDIFAFACIAYELISCKHPYNRKPVDIVLKEKLNLAKPNSLPFYAWRPIKKILSYPEDNTFLSAKKLKDSLNFTLKPKIAVSISAILALSITIILINYYEGKISSANKIIDQRNNDIKYQQTLLNTPPEKFLTLTNSDKLEPIVREGLLRHNQTALLNYFESKIDDIINKNDNKFPDYNKIELVLKNAENYFPDSHRLELLSLDIKSSKRSTLLAIERQINSALEKASYESLDDGKSVLDLYYDLNEINKDYPFTPSPLASDIFGKNLKKALAQQDALALKKLLNIGNVFFTSFEQHKENLSLSNQMKDAIEKMSLYLTEKKKGRPVDYPYDAARVLYKDALEELYRRIENASSINTLDGLVTELNKLATKLPSDFSDISDVRFKIADKYLKLSDILLKNREGTNARRAVQKANELLRQVDRG
ncbi:serine/threonine-protein kinase [Vibrio metschnikovii]|uniref:serine/threonine-protein kinase n=1 Tax=Vibrio metschnikovii TaxID=28172 RepID=UPI001C2FA3F6|nr:serine/threonine-protein kinase [Vibrio metschnikovii]EKO3564620.1 serine/threonine protein kinase [Vibrio metschnikovii]EKO3769311.1 serine/threonine protein kinase [Vibrio metschnikovii]